MERVKKFFVVATLLIIVGELYLSNAQNVCNTLPQDLLPCKPATTPPHPPPPTGECCLVLARGGMSCLCSFVNSNLLPALGIDPDLALQLPAKCNLPHIPNCRIEA
ncbi:hypothetical protein JCGZ_23822 [Jatropha curcas]|uniref:Bifunctional inhibitor/plant lipid transfer protein/seed storage helical domain-containing protein n=1 Tax=Jatropha curcas TaxID=180498 RepID=A0A067LEE0_JATCU|nr:hypothetical protein JCGZ_23822 [Jatropha curcas]